MARSSLQLNTFLGPYYLVKLIAVGGMAEIYLATTKGVGGFEKQLALKIIHSDFADDRRFVQMLVDEAKIAVKLNHPNIAQTFDLGKIGNCYFISMEFVDGADFFQILKRTSEMGLDFPIAASLLVTHEALRGLDYAHKKCDDDGQPLQIIHRDISPQNILLSRQGEAKIVDFGIAKAANLSTKTRSGVIKGKLVYMSPEQSWGETVDQRSDIFSAGIVLYEALTGGSLYLEKNPVKLLEMVRKAAIPPPSARRGPEITPELDHLVMKALNPKPDGRYRTAADFADVLADYMARTMPDYTSVDLARQIALVLGPPDPPPVLPPGLPPMAVISEGSMRREDFEVPVNSIIFRAEEMMESQMSLPRVTPNLTRPQAMRCKLVLLEKEGDTAYPLSDEFVLGRAGDLRLSDARVSRRHARVYLRDGQYLVEDLGSANGTFLNEAKVQVPSPLRPGDLIRIGPFTVRFDVDGRGSKAATPTTTPEPPEMDSLPPVDVGQARRVAHTIPADDLDGESLDQLRVEEMQSTSGHLPQPEPAPTPPPQRLVRPTVMEGDDDAFLVCILGGEELRLEVGSHLALGSVLLAGGQEMQGMAADLVRRSDGFWIEPVPGRERVILNGQALSGPSQVRPGDRLRVGPVDLDFLV